MHIHKSGPALLDMRERFRQLPFLQSLDDTHLRELLNASRLLSYEVDELILPEGGFGDRLYILLKGRVRVVKYKSVVAMLTQPGDVFGELSVLGDETRSASVFAAEPVLCLEFSPVFLQKLPEVEQPACYATLYRFIARIIAARLKTTTTELAMVGRELEVTRRKLSEMRLSSGQNAWDDELGQAIDQLRRTKERLTQLGRDPDLASPT